MLNTILDRFVILWDAPKDWSLNGGLIWLVGILAAYAITLAFVSISDLVSNLTSGDEE
jgi:hypothetical protein